MNLRVKIGIAVGCVIFYHIANDYERHFGEAGQTIEEVNIAQSSASSGTVVVSQRGCSMEIGCPIISWRRFFYSFTSIIIEY